MIRASTFTLLSVLLWTLLWALLWASPAAAQPLPTTVWSSDSVHSSGYDPREFVTWLEATLNDEGVPGAALAIVSRDGVLRLQTWGVTSLAAPRIVDPHSVFRIASMSKTFAGAAATIIVDDRLQSWDAPIRGVLPGLNLGSSTDSQRITLRHVASQSTGLMPHSYSNLLDDGMTYTAIKQRFNTIPSVCPPGQCYSYQNAVFSLIAEVVESATDDSYEDFLQERLFTPLGMVTASVGIEAYEAATNNTAPHRRRRGRWHATTTNPAYYTVAPASGINASIRDMARWLQANLGAFPQVLSPEVLDEMHSPVVATTFGSYFNKWKKLKRAHYAIGWRVFEYGELRAVHHGGGVRGYRSEMAVVPAADIGFVVLLNGETNAANDFVPAFLDSLLGNPLNNDR